MLISDLSFAHCGSKTVKQSIIPSPETLQFPPFYLSNASSQLFFQFYRFKGVNFLFENGVVESKTCNSFIQKDCVIFYRCATGDHTGNYYIITSCLSVTSPSRIVVLKLSNKA